jgi:hypothetical protein
MKKIISRYVKKLQEWFLHDPHKERLHALAEQQFKLLNSKITMVRTIRELVNVRAQIKKLKPWLVKNEIYSVYETQYVELYNRWNNRLLIWKKRGY